MKLFRMMAALLATLGLLSGCGGGSDSGSSGNGSVVIGITDAEGDFLAYAVDVTSIKLTHADGRVVETLPRNARIDFAQYVDLTEFVTAATIPNGRYTKAALVLDYRNADIQVEVAGQPVAAEVRDGNGDPITTLEVAVTLSGDHPLVIAPGVARHLTLDFDLQTSNSVDTSGATPRVTVEPLLVADVEMDAPKHHRLRGLLQGVDEAQSLIQLQLRPFQRRDGDFGSFNAYADGDTNYEIDGLSYSGSEGLAQLAQQPQASWIVLFGDIDSATRRFVASEVYAGSSVPGTTQDALSGVVTARSGDQLTMRARMIVRTDGSLIFNKDVTVNLDAATTTVTRQLSRDSAAIGDISVGQRLELLGAITGDNGSALTMAATQARMMVSYLSGNVIGMSGGLEVSLQHLDGTVPAAYDFSGTGGSALDDADPANYEIDTATLDLGALQSGDPVRVRGFVTPFGSAPHDFSATTIVGLKSVPARLMVQWPIASRAPLLSSTATELVIDLTGSRLHHVQRYDVRTDLTTLGQPPALRAAADDKGLFAIRRGNTVQLYTRFSAFETALSGQLAAGGRVKHLGALGRFDDDQAVMTVQAINVVMR